MKINMNTIAKEVTKEEGKKVSVTIAQVKEVLKITFANLRKNYRDDEIIELMDRYV